MTHTDTVTPGPGYLSPSASVMMTRTSLVPSLLTLVSLVTAQAPAPDSPAVLYLPLGGSGPAECQPAAGAKLTQLVPLM